MNSRNILKEYHKRWLEEEAQLLDDHTALLKEEFALYRNCPLCEFCNSELLFIKRGFRFVQCKKCCFIYVNPIVDDRAIANVHTFGAYSFYCSQSQGKPPPMESRDYIEILKRISVYINNQKGRLLDIGCGKGIFLKFAGQFGFETWGVEISESAARCAEDISGSKIISGKFENAALPGKYFDAVTLFQVLEHLENPLAVLRDTHNLLKAGGIIIVDVPNIDSFIIKITKQHHRHFTGREHINYFTPTTLNGMLSKAGFKEILKVETRGEECSPSTILQLLMNPAMFDFFSPQHFQTATVGGLVTRYLTSDRVFPITRRIYGIIAATVDQPFKFITNMLNKGAYVRIYARK